jgi:uncharacterized membrane protein
MRKLVSGHIRSARERLLQTLGFEFGAFLLIAPLFSLATDSSMAESYVLIAALSVAAMLWAAAFNTAYDLIEHRWTGRVASDRPHGWRIFHALALEATQVVVSCPLIYLIIGMSWVGALMADLALTVVYAAYGYLFHLAFDRLRPVRTATPAGLAQAYTALRTSTRLRRQPGH